MNIAIVIQARLNSSRLPGKVIKKINGTPVLSLIIKRLEKKFSRDMICLSTSNHSSDDPLIAYAKEESIQYSRGDLDNIVQRMLNAGKKMESDIIIRLWGDSPMICADVIQSGYEKFKNQNLDYLSTFLTKETYPGGLDFEIYRCSTLKDILKENDSFFLEFPFEWVKKNELLKKSDIQSTEDYSHLTMTLDYPEDLERLNSFYEKYGENINEWSFSILMKHAQKEKKIFDSNLPRNIEYNEKRKNL